MDLIRRKSLYGVTHKGGTTTLAAAQAALANGVCPAPSDLLTAAQYLDRWLEDAAERHVPQEPYASYRQLVRLHLVPGPGRIQLIARTRPDVQRFMNRKLASSLSPHTLDYGRAVLRKALNDALRWGVGARSVATVVNPPKQEHVHAAFSTSVRNTGWESCSLRRSASGCGRAKCRGCAGRTWISMSGR